MHSVKQLRRLRVLVLIVVLAGIGSSVTMNVFHAPDRVVARFVAAIPPLAVFACLELIARIPSSSRILTGFRIFGAVVVALGAAGLSYAQQYAAVLGLGFPHWQSMIWPGVIDGTMIVASVSLVEVVRKIRQMTDSDQPSKVRQWADQFEDPATLAYRDAQRKLREDSAVVALNGSKVPAAVS